MSREQARRVLAHKAVKDVLLDMEGASKAALLADMQLAGSERIRVKDDDDADLGAVSYSNGRKTPKVTDPIALLRWVKDGYPSEVTETVRPAFLTKILGWVKDYREPVTPTGEVIPGVEYAEGEPFLTVRPTDTARDRVREALGQSLPELTAGDQ